MFLSFEGIDGSGKSTQAKLLSAALRSRGFEVCRVREPGGTPLGERIRLWLLDRESEITPRAELLLFSAARAHLVDTIIEPALERGEIVIADRFYDSTTAYQGAGRGVANEEWLDGFHHFVVKGIAPSRTYLMDIQPSTAAERLEEREHSDRMEAVGQDFFARAASAYRILATRHSDRIAVIDATNAVMDTHKSILKDVLGRIA